MDSEPQLPAARRTAFVKGDHFLADVTAQGMVIGRRYVVVDLDENITPFGNFVSYLVRDADGGDAFWVGNLHLLATLVAT
ncbi:MAG TPA: hypothetical protein VFZ65_01445 [Planctomycetota bacterium]|nr:hypothetical protein [Planctomycetota bacterium]